MFDCKECGYRTEDPEVEKYHKLKHQVKVNEQEQVKLMNDEDFQKFVKECNE